MSYTIGVAALIDSPAYDKIRDVELLIAVKTQNFAGLNQAPHVTVKRPFSVATIDDVKAVKDAMNKLSSRLMSFEINLGGPSSFGSSVVFASVEDTDELQGLHEHFLRELKPLYNKADEFEGKNIVFHATLAHELTESECATALKVVSSQKDLFPIKCSVSKLGLFLKLKEQQCWTVISIAELGTSK